MSYCHVWKFNHVFKKLRCFSKTHLEGLFTLLQNAHMCVPSARPSLRLSNAQETRIKQSHSASLNPPIPSRSFRRNEYRRPWTWRRPTAEAPLGKRYRSTSKIQAVRWDSKIVRFKAEKNAKYGIGTRPWELNERSYWRFRNLRSMMFSGRSDRYMNSFWIFEVTVSRRSSSADSVKVGRVAEQSGLKKKRPGTTKRAPVRFLVRHEMCECLQWCFGYRNMENFKSFLRCPKWLAF